jgi:hypothetical protein
MRLEASAAVPDLGSSLGKVAVPGAADPSQLDDIRERLLAGVLQMAGDAREAATEGRRDAMLIALGRSAWLEAWELAVRAAADRVVARAEQRLADAARRARLPRRRRRRLPVSSSERRALTARLGSVGGAFIEALDRLEVAAHGLREADPADRELLDTWQDAVLGTVRRLDTAWVALQNSAVHEEAMWRGEAELLAAWRPPLWPVFAIGLPVAAVLVWLGLVGGGYLPVPTWLGSWLP